MCYPLSMLTLTLVIPDPSPGRIPLATLEAKPVSILTLNTLVVGYKRKDFWLDISARDTFSQKRGWI